jgi:hypothetical protein
MTKEEYKAVKCAWSRSVNNKEFKPYKDDTYGTKYDGKLNAVHFVVYNILRGLPAHRGFEQEGRGYMDACERLNFLLKFERAEKLLFPFENLVTLDSFKELL